MRPIGKIVAGAAGFLLAMPAAAAVTHEQAFDLCVAQPTLQPEYLRPMVEHMLSGPHPPVFDSMTMPQIINDFRYRQGSICADQLVRHPDAFGFIFSQRFVSKERWTMAWLALNIYCQNNPTGACIRGEVDANEAIEAANDKEGKASAPSFRLCDAVLEREGYDPVQQKQYMDAVGDLHPDEQVIQDCLRVLDWGSQPDAAAAGREIGECFSLTVS